MFKKKENLMENNGFDTSRENDEIVFSLRNNPNFRYALKTNEESLESLGISKDSHLGVDHVSYIRKLCTMLSFDWSRYFSAARNAIFSYYMHCFKQKVEVDVIRKFVQLN